MELSVPVNHNYYEESPLTETELNVIFKTRSLKKIKEQTNRLFSKVYELTTKDQQLRQLQIFGFKDQKNKLEEEERLILKLFSKEGVKGENQYYVQTGLYAGIIYHKGCKFNITTNYGDTFLLRMLNFVNDIYIDTQDSPASKKEESNEFQFIIAYLFIQSLEKAAILGLPQEYKTLSQRSQKVRGKIDINAYLKSDIPFLGKLTTTYREQVYVQEIVDILYVALRKLERKFGKDINKKLVNINQLLKQHYSGRFINYETIIKAKNHQILYNPIYASFKKVLEYAEIILMENDLAPVEDKNKLETFGFLFDISQLFEVYLEKLLSTHFKNWYVNSQTELKLYNGMFYHRRMFPDIVMKHKGSDKLVVLDAKFKTMRLEPKPSHISDLDRNDFYQIHTYMQYYMPNLVLGGLIYPLSNPFNLDNCFSENLFGDQNKKEPQFLVDGVEVFEKMNMPQLMEKEKEFLTRLQSIFTRNDFDCYEER